MDFLGQLVVRIQPGIIRHLTKAKVQIIRQSSKVGDKNNSLMKTSLVSRKYSYPLEISAERVGVENFANYYPLGRRFVDHRDSWSQILRIMINTRPINAETVTLTHLDASRESLSQPDAFPQYGQLTCPKQIAHLPVTINPVSSRCSMDPTLRVRISLESSDTCSNLRCH